MPRLLTGGRPGADAHRPLAMAVALLAVAAVGCGKKGPPLAPFTRVPAAVATVTPQRVGDDMYVSFAVPAANADGRKPADIVSVDVYAVTAERAPATEKERDVASLVASLPVRPILPELPAPANESAAPAIPLPPGVDRGATVAVREPITEETKVAVELPVDRLLKKKPAVDDETAEEIVAPLVAPPATRLPRRHYFVVGVSSKGKKSTPSTPVSVPLELGSSAPGMPTLTSDASSILVTWTPPPDVRTAVFLPPEPPAPPPAPVNGTPSNVTPRTVVPLPPITAKTLGYPSEPTKYNVYDVTPSTNQTPPDPYALTVPASLSTAPLTVTQLVVPKIAFGVERCFVVRPVDDVYGTVVIGPSSPQACITPQDTYPPAAPTSLAAIAAPGAINLIWDPNTDPDLAGYVVLRAEAPGDTLQPITKEPITTTTFRDESVRPGVRYVYAVVAVDRATPANTSPPSNRVEETARQ